MRRFAVWYATTTQRQCHHAHTAENSPTNQYDGVISIWHNDMNYALRGGPAGVKRLQIHTGPRIPSNILSEVDHKIDDGLANSGSMVFNQYDPTNGGMPSLSACMNERDGTPPGSDVSELLSDKVFLYRLASRDPSVEGNCGAGIFIWR